MSLARYLAAGVGTAATVGLVLASAASPALAQSDGEPVVTNRETVQAFLTTDGEIDVARVYDQIDAYGTGEVTLENPVSTQGLRNLDGFGRPEVRDGVAVQTLDVDGEARLRTVSDFDGELPVTITPRYRLDGEVVDAGDLVGASGTVEVSYTVENVTGEPTEVTFTDGTGEEVTRTVDVPIPMVGQLVTVLPGTFTEVRSDEATVSGDGRGGTRLSFTMTLFPPIGSTTAEFAWTAQTSDGSLAPATVSVAPVRPLESPSFRGGAESYRGGAETGAELTDGATQIDSNLLRLRDGAAELLDGLILLRNGADELRAGLQGEAAPGADRLAAGAEQAADGADELAAGLSGTAVPGSQELAAGSNQAAAGAASLASGLGRLNAGAGALAGGAAQLDSGAGQVAAGSVRLRDGLQEATVNGPLLLAGLAQVSDGLEGLDAGLALLSTGIGGLETNPDVQRLRAGIQQIIAGIGSNSTEGTLLYGLARTDGGLRQLKAELGQADAALGNLYSELGCGTAIAPSVTTCVEVNPAATSPNPQDPTGPQIPTGVLADNTLAQVRTGAQNGVIGIGEFGSPETLLDAVNRVRCGLDNGSRAAEPGGCGPEPAPGVLQGMLQVQGGVEALIDSVIASVQGVIGTPTSGTNTLRGGVAALQGGVDQLEAGGARLAAGLGQLADGSEELAAGAGQVAGGASQVNDGAQQLADGTGQAASGAGALADGNRRLADGNAQLADGLVEAADGSVQLADGNAQIADGAGQLADGLGDAADGSGQLADGLVQAADGTPQIVDGAERLSVEGTSLLIEAGNETALDFGERFATVEAATERARDSGMPYGAPEGATGTAAYSIEIAGADGEGARNLGRGLLALGIFGGVAGVTALARRGV